MLQQLPHPTALADSSVQQPARQVPSSLQEFLTLQHSRHSAACAGHAGTWLPAPFRLPADYTHDSPTNCRLEP